MITKREPGDYSDFAADALRTDSQVSEKAINAETIITVYGKLGLLKPGKAEELGDTLPGDIELLCGLYPGEELEPFLAVTLTQKFGIRALLAAFDEVYKGQYEKSFCGSYWDNLDLAMLNRRTVGMVDGSATPLNQLSLRGAVMTGDSEYGEPGLILPGKTVAEQRLAATGITLFSGPDWLALEALRREAGILSLDRKTFTRFPQQDEVLVGGNSTVGLASSYGLQADLRAQNVGRYHGVGVRRSVGLR